VAWFDPGRVRSIAGGAAALLISAGIALSYSRAGLVASVLAVACFLLLTRSSRSRVVLAVVLLALPMAWLLRLEIRAPGERFGALASDVGTGGGRIAVWRTTLGLFSEQPVLGHGLGTFESAYSPRQTAETAGRYDHAHNDWLEAGSEGGLLAVVPMLAALVLAMGAMVRSRRAPAPEGAALRVAAGAGVAAVALHSLVDFGLRIPASAVLLVLLLAVLTAAESDAGDQVACFEDRVERRRRRYNT
jgi:O-antigen ligase